MPLFEEIAAASKAAGRSMNAEVVDRLQRSFILDSALEHRHDVIEATQWIGADPSDPLNVRAALTTALENMVLMIDGRPVHVEVKKVRTAKPVATPEAPPEPPTIGQDLKAQYFRRYGKGKGITGSALTSTELPKLKIKTTK